MRIALLVLMSASLARAQVDEATRAGVVEAVRHLPTASVGFSMNLDARNGFAILGMNTGSGIYVGTGIAELERRLAERDDPIARVELARLYLIDDRSQKVIDHAKAALAAIDPQTADPQLQECLILAHLLLGEYADAERIATAMLAADPTGRPALLLARAIGGRLQSERNLPQALGGDVQKMLGLLDAYSKAHPEDPEPWVWFAIARSLARELVEALGDQAPAGLRMETRDAMREAAKRADRQVEILVTCAFMNAMTRYDNTPPAPRITKDNLLPRLPGDIVAELEATEAKLSALLDDPDRQVAADALMALALMTFAIHADQAGMMALLEQHVAALPGDHPVWVLYGAGLAEQGRYEDLLKLAGQRAAEEDSAFLRVTMGRCHLMLGRLDEAETEFDAATALDAEDPAPPAGLAAVELSRGDEEALKHADELIAWIADLAKPGDRRTQIDLAVLRCAAAMLRGDRDAAQRALAAITAPDPGEAVTRLRQLLNPPAQAN